jgi:hypothetical protein
LKGALKAAAALAISARSVLLLPAWLLAHEESIVLLFASEKTVQSFPALHKVLVSNGTLSKFGHSNFLSIQGYFWRMVTRLHVHNLLQKK